MAVTDVVELVPHAVLPADVEGLVAAALVVAAAVSAPPEAVGRVADVVGAVRVRAAVASCEQTLSICFIVVS